MQIVLLALVFGLAACQEAIDFSKVSGEWKTVAVAADNLDKISPGGDLRVYLRRLDCLDAQCTQLKVTFYAQENDECQKFEVVGTNNGNGVYEGDYSGKNYFSILGHKDDMIAFVNRNVDEAGRKTKMILVAGKRDNLSEEEQSQLITVLHQKRIPLANARLVANSAGGVSGLWEMSLAGGGFRST
ncbi:lipocalin Cav p 3.0101-like [Ctenodactylus gundi]